MNYVCWFWHELWLLVLTHSWTGLITLLQDSFIQCLRAAKVLNHFCFSFLLELTKSFWKLFNRKSALKLKSLKGQKKCSHLIWFLVIVDSSFLTFSPQSFACSKKTKITVKRTSPNNSSLTLERAKDVQANLAPEFPSLVKYMLHSHVTGGFWLVSLIFLRSFEKNVEVARISGRWITIW